MLASCLCKNPHHLLAWPILSISWAKCHFMFSTVHFCTATFSFIKILNIANPFRTYFDRLWFYVEVSICLSSVLRNHIFSPHVCWPKTNKQIKSATVISAILLWNKQITNEMYTRLKEITHDLSNAPFSVLPAQGAHKNGMAQRWSKDELSSTAREIFIYLKNPEFELKNYLAFRRDKTKNTSLFIPKIRGLFISNCILWKSK